MRALVLALALLLQGCSLTFRGVDWHVGFTTTFEFDEMGLTRHQREE